MKTRNELIEEIIESFEENFRWTGKFNEVPRNKKEIDEIKSLLRTALLKISDASMDAVEVEEKLVEHFGSNPTEHCEQCIAEINWNFACNASQEKRATWVK